MSQTRWVAVAGVVALALFRLILPEWLTFVLTMAMAKSLVVLGVVLLMRGGLVSFGQGMYLALGAYTVAFASKFWGIREMLILLPLAGLVGFVAAYLIGLLVARYREVFFGMLCLAFSMALYGVLVKSYAVGGTDGLNVPVPTFLGARLQPGTAQFITYYLALAALVVSIYLSRRYVQSPLGYVMSAIRDNEVRVEYLGGSVRNAVTWTFALAGTQAGLAGALLAFAVGHVDPQLAYWTTSGEFVFAGLLGGTASVLAPLTGSLVLEFLKTYAYKYAPYTWQLVLGSVMLLIILFLPNGLWSLYERLSARGAKT